jgi:hypothetical protein
MLKRALKEISTWHHCILCSPDFVRGERTAHSKLTFKIRNHVKNIFSSKRNAFKTLDILKTSPNIIQQIVKQVISGNTKGIQKLRNQNLP